MKQCALKLFIVCTGLALLAFSSSADTKSREPASDEQIKWQVIASGDTESSSSNHRLTGTVAQTAVGYGGSASYGLNSGYWQDFGCCIGIRGNVDGDPGDAINVADLTYLVDYQFFDGPPPPCFEEGDVDGSGAINVADLTYLVDFLFFSGPAPAPCP